MQYFWDIFLAYQPKRSYNITLFCQFITGKRTKKRQKILTRSIFLLLLYFDHQDHFFIQRNFYFWRKNEEKVKRHLLPLLSFLARNLSLSVCSEYLNIQIYLNIYWRIYSFAQIFVQFFKENIFGHSFQTFFPS